MRSILLAARRWFRFDPEMLTYVPPPDELLEQYRAAMAAATEAEARP